MSEYKIVDEPKVKRSAHLIVNPIIILLVSIFLPIFWMPPFYGRWWMPLVWIVFNGYLLGSPTLKQEVIISIIGLLTLFGMLEGFVYLTQVEPFNQMKSLVQYALISLNGAFFFILYLVVFKQSVPFELFKYKQQR